MTNFLVELDYVCPAGCRILTPEIVLNGIGEDIGLTLTVFSICQVEELHRETSVPSRHDDGTVMWLHSPVNNHTITIQQPCIPHWMLPISKS